MKIGECLDPQLWHRKIRLLMDPEDSSIMCVDDLPWETIVTASQCRIYTTDMMVEGEGATVKAYTQQYVGNENGQPHNPFDRPLKERLADWQIIR